MDQNPTGLNFRLETPKLDKLMGYSLADKSALFADSHFVYAEILINGEKALTDVTYTLNIQQKTLDHSTFSIQCPGEAFENLGDYPLKNTQYLLGKKISVFLKQKGQTALSFTGIICSATHGRDDNRSASLTLSGYAPTILMERGKSSLSFENLSLEDIAKKIMQNGNYPSDKLEVNFKPNHKELIPYLVQYQQSDWGFIASLAQRYGEWLYHDGTKLVFGGFGGKTLDLAEEEELESYSLKLHTAPQNFEYTAYQADTRQVVKSNTSALQKTEIVNPFHHQAVKASKEIYAQTAETLYNLSLLENGEKELSEEIKREAQARQNLVYLEGRSQNPTIRVGDIVKLKGYMPDNSIFKDGKIPLESYLITEIRHYYHEADGYYNTFTGIPKEQLIPPYYDARAYAKAETQRATVTDNNDPKGIGRIRVRFDWQKEADQSPWIRIVFPYAGANKGFYFIPEMGEEVMVSFESDNPEKPYVLGTHYSGKEKSGYYTAENDIKAIHTRSGTKIILNDAEGSVFIEDPSGNTYLMDGQGNIKVNAPKNIEIAAGENMDVNVGKNLTFNVAEQAILNIMQKMLITTPYMKQLVTDFYHTQAGKALINSSNEIKLESPETYVAGQRKLFLHSDETATLNSKGIAELKGETKNSFSNVADSHETVKEEHEAEVLVVFRPHGNWKGEYGFDWFRGGDSGLNTDPSYFGKIVGKHYTDASYTTVFQNTNSWSVHFKQDWGMYDKILKTYKNHTVAWKPKVKGNTYLDPMPVMTMLKGEKHKVTLKVEINKKPKKLFVRQKKSVGNEPDYFKFHNSNLEIRDKGTYGINNRLEIECIQSFKKDQIIEVVADDKVCGRLKILANDSSRFKHIPIVFVNILSMFKGDELEGKPITGGEAFFLQGLKQAYTFPKGGKIESVRMNMHSLIEKEYCNNKGIKQTIGKYNGKELLAYLDESLNQACKGKYKNHYKLYFLAIPYPHPTMSGFSISGFSRFNTLHGIYFEGHDKSTVTHETLHAVGLPHTFDGKSSQAKFSYKAQYTDNLMDYCHWGADIEGNPRTAVEGKSLFRWQMIALNPKLIDND